MRTARGRAGRGEWVRACRRCVQVFGKSLNVTALSVLLALVLWNALWGIPGVRPYAPRYTMLA